MKLTTEQRQLTSQEVRLVMSSLGKKGGLIGGKRRALKLTKERRIEIAKQGSAARWSKGQLSLLERLKKHRKTVAGQIIFNEEKLIELASKNEPFKKQFHELLLTKFKWLMSDMEIAIAQIEELGKKNCKVVPQSRTGEI